MTSTDTPTTTAAPDGTFVARDDIATTIAQLAEVRRQAAVLKTLDGQLVAALRDANLPAGNITAPDGRALLTVSRSSSFDRDVAAKVLGDDTHYRKAVTSRSVVPAAVLAALGDGRIPADLFDELTEASIDPALAKSQLPPAVYAACLVPAANPSLTPAKTA